MIIEGNFRNAIALARLGLYETLELVKWEGGDSFYVDVDEDQFCVEHNGYYRNERVKTSIPMSIVRANGMNYR